MDGQNYNSKDVFRLRIRICLLLVLVAFILGFLFSPKVKMEVEIEDPGEDTVYFYPYEPEEFENIAESPGNDVDDVNSEEKYEEEDEDLDLDEKDLPFGNDKDADVKFGTPVYIPHSVKPKPLNLDEVKFGYPKSMTMLGVSGTVYLQLFIDKEGNVKNVVKMNSLHPTLDKIAVENAWKIKFSPAQQRDKPVAVWYAFWVEFKLE